MQTLTLFLLTLLMYGNPGQATFAEDPVPRVVALVGADTTVLNRLDSLFPSALIADSATTEEEEALFTTWQEYLEAMSTSLNDSGLEPDSLPPIFIRIYCESDGAVAHCAYAFLQEQSLDTEARFAAVVETFISTRRFGATFSRRFSQCGQVVFRTKSQE